ncbi:mitochondrial amidoxime-reducing component 1-like isoform X1 [Ptychodera flava]|uniref:mitochondrial amidoxime-reducing component 1-like isoform X1 n=1 Tax=Ptychodera flava TaxID=63121 RepID=UPI003969DF16
MSETEYSKPLVIASLAVCAAGTAWFLWRSSKQPKRNKVAVGKVSSVYLYPVKSCGRIELAGGRCTQLGLKSGPLKDRHWLIVDGDNNFTTMRQEPRMCLIQPSLSEDEKYLQLDAVNMPTLKVPVNINEVPKGEQEIINTRVWRNNVQGKYCGEVAEVWLSSFFDKPNFKLVFLDNLPPRMSIDDPLYKHIAQQDDAIAYQDSSSYNILGEASLKDLNQRLENPVSMKNFRPNFVISGSKAFEEDEWKYLQIGDTSFRRYKYCQRCKVTTVDPETGIMNETEPLQTLRSYRLCKEDSPEKSIYGLNPLFGVNIMAENEGTVRVGDTVYACYD